MKGKLGVIIFAFTFFVLASACIGNAGMEAVSDRQTAQDTDRGVSGGNQSYNSSGAMRVDRDLYPFHYGDVNQFGDDEAYNSLSGKVSTGVRYPIHREDP